MARGGRGRREGGSVLRLGAWFGVENLRRVKVQVWSCLMEVSGSRFEL